MIFTKAFKSWQDDKVPTLSAAISYYAIFSVAPLIILLFGLSGMFFDAAVFQKDILFKIRDTVGPNAARTIRHIIETAHSDKTGLTIIISSVVLIFGAAGVFGQLKDALNVIWRVAPKPERRFWTIVRNQLLSITMVVIMCFLLISSTILTSLLTVLANYFRFITHTSHIEIQAIDVVISTFIVMLLFSIIYELLPDVVIPAKYIWPGALAASVLFTIGKYAIGVYVKFGNIGSAYGAAGSVIVILLWIYYVSQILLYGAELTKILYMRENKSVVPKNHARIIAS